MNSVFFSICDGHLGYDINVTRGVNLDNQKELYFHNGKRYRVENLHRSLFLRNLLLDGDKTLKVLAIFELGFL